MGLTPLLFWPTPFKLHQHRPHIAKNMPTIVRQHLPKMRPRRHLHQTAPKLVLHQHPNCTPPSTSSSILQNTFPFLLEVRTPMAFSYLGNKSQAANMKHLDRGNETPVTVNHGSLKQQLYDESSTIHMRLIMIPTVPKQKCWRFSTG